MDFWALAGGDLSSRIRRDTHKNETGWAVCSEFSERVVLGWSLPCLNRSLSEHRIGVAIQYIQSLQGTYPTISNRPFASQPPWKPPTPPADRASWQTTCIVEYQLSLLGSSCMAVSTDMEVGVQKNRLFEQHTCLKQHVPFSRAFFWFLISKHIQLEKYLGLLVILTQIEVHRHSNYWLNQHSTAIIRSVNQQPYDQVVNSHCTTR